MGISLDGIGAVNDAFRVLDGAFGHALNGIRECRKRGIKVGLRFTLTEQNAHMLGDMLDLCDGEEVDNFYLSHLVYAGRGDKNRGDDRRRSHTRRAMDLLIDRAWDAVTGGQPLEIVTGNNDADAVIVYDARTLEEVKRLPMRKPSGKYNVWNKITFSDGTSH